MTHPAPQPLTEEDRGIVAQNDAFLLGFNEDIHQRQTGSPLFGGGGSPLLKGTETSKLNLAPQPLQAEVNRTGAIEKPKAAEKKTAGAIPSIAAPLSSGIAAGNQVRAQTTDVPEAIAEVGLSTLGGTVSGALTGATIGAAGGPIGALGGAAIGGLSALVIGGTKAWFGVRSARKRSRALKELQRKAARQREQDIARNEKWARLNRFDSLQVAEENRKQVELQNKWASYQNVSATMIGMANSDAKLNQNLRNQMLGVN